VKTNTNQLSYGTFYARNFRSAHSLAAPLDESSRRCSLNHAKGKQAAVKETGGKDRLGKAEFVKLPPAPEKRHAQSHSPLNGSTD
jgi:hypothetical protein